MVFYFVLQSDSSYEVIMMSLHSAAVVWRQTPELLRGRVDLIEDWLARSEAGRLLAHLTMIIAGTGLFGAAVGCWRAPLQAFYTGLKLPLIVLLTTFGNALLNSMLAPLLGLRFKFRQSLTAMVLSFAIAGVILAAFSPLLAFLVWNTPAADPSRGAGAPAYDVLLLAQAAAIAWAGVASHLRLWQWLCRAAGSRAVAARVLLAWLAVNLLLGGQLAWILRPFVGNPSLPVRFLRADAWAGNFFEAIFHTLERLLHS